MSSCFSVKPDALFPSVVSSTSFHLQSLSRREILGSGCGIQMRTPGPRRRMVRGKLGLQILSPRCVLYHDMLYDSSILVIAATVAVFAAIELAHPNRNGGGNSKRGMDNACSEPKCFVGLECGELSEDTGIPLKERIEKRISAAVLSKDLPIELHQVDGPKDSLFVDQIKLTKKTTLVFDNSEGLPAKQEMFLSDSNEHSLKFFHIANCLDIPVKGKQRDFCQSEHYGAQQVMADGSELPNSNYNGDQYRSIKENYYCSEELTVNSISCFNMIKEPINLIIGSGCHDLKQSMMREEVLDNRGAEISDVLERQTHFICSKKVFSNNEKGLSKGKNSTQKIDKSPLRKKEHKPSSRFIQSNGGLVEHSSNLETYLGNYECLLRDARLNDCLDLLESMRRKGLLDMDKVHHTRFLYACKSQNAVKEAFRFCKLIDKPTLSLFNMLLSVCANSQDFDGAFQVVLLMKEAKLKPDCKLYTTLISACGKCEKVDAMFEVFHEMVSSGVEPNANTYGALIDGCARAGQLAKAFGVYGIMRSKNVQPDRVVFNALITACGRSGALDRAFDVLAEMRAEPKPIDPDHITIGALLKACIQAGQVHRAPEVYKMLHLYNIKGTPDVYTIAVNSCSHNGDLDFALMIYEDMKRNEVEPDEMFLSTIIDAAGHAQNVDAAFSILKDARSRGIHVGSMTYSSLMGACSNAKNWKKALELYEDIKAIKLLPTVSTLNALVTVLCEGDQLPKSIQVLNELKEAGVHPNVITYSILIVACEKKDEAELGFALHSKAKQDGILPNLIMCRCLTGLCLQSYERACSLGESVVSFNSGKPEIISIWTSRAIMVYRETISSGEIPSIEVFSQVLGCLQFPRDSLLRNDFIENLGLNFDASSCSNISSYLYGFGEYDTRSFSVLEEAASLQVVPRVSFKESPIVLDARKLPVHTVEVYILTILKGLKYRLAAGTRLPCITIMLSREKAIIGSHKGERTVFIAARVGQAVGSLLRRLGLRYQGDESYGKIRITGLTLRRWFRPKVASFSVTGRPGDMIPSTARLAKGLAEQHRNIRSSTLSLE